ncbi:MAG: cytochrome c-type biogenesis CcmF C-terminal domain-containing protein [Sandaracinaceae bacterium]
MTEVDIPTLGTLMLGAVLVSAAFTFMLSIAAAAGRPHLLRSVRFGTLATVALVACAVFLLAYSFQAHDFRIRYVARYSDRSMSPIYLWTSLWGGQDGSLLWWTFLSSGYITAFTIWVRDKHRALQPVMFATLMSVIAFFVVLQLFAANPFATTFGGAPPDGEGLNPLLQNYWMVIHPPALYMGLTGWSVPFAFVVAALVTGRLDDSWFHGARKWVLVAWGFLSLGNMLGMFWSYEELGWGGYWAWDPVENASFLPWLAGTAYLHSVMITERRGTMKVWNVTLLLLTFVLTIFGTFLTRSGLISSVHSFARSDIGVYFGGYLIALIAFVFLLVGYRLPDLRNGARIGPVHYVVGAILGLLLGLFLVIAGVEVTWVDNALVARFLTLMAAAFVGVSVFGLLKLVEVIRLDVLGVAPMLGKPQRGMESLLSREFAFLLNNWILLGMAVFVLLATTFPLISELLRDETVSVGPGYYNKWMIPFGLILMFLTGVGPLIAWRKATGKNLLQAFAIPTGLALLVFVLHLALGSTLGFPPTAEWDDIYDDWVGEILAAIYSVAPIVSTTVCAFVTGTIAQEYGRGLRVRMKSTGENPLLALFELVTRAKRRYGGYVVHLGLVLMFIGFTGAAYDTEAESSLMPGESLTVGDYTFRYDNVRMEADPNKRMVFTEVSVIHGGEVIDVVEPAKFIYRTHPDMPTTEVAIRTTLLSDLYVIMSTVDPATRRGTFRVIVRPLVAWIWLGGAVLLLGVFIAVSPRVADILGVVSMPSLSRPRAAAAATTTLLLLLSLIGWALAPPGHASAQSDSSSSLHAGTVVIEDPEERRLFGRLLCECGDCARLPLDTCACSWADGMRSELRGRLARGDDVTDIVSEYRERFGAASIAIPSDEGLDRALWALPVTAILLAAGALVWRARTWARQGSADTQKALAGEDEGGAIEYEQQLEDELRRLEGD